MKQGPIIVSRAEALRLGLKEYFTGKPCKYGHIAPRKLLGKCGVCSACRKTIATAWREENREKHNAWGRENPEARRASQNKYLENHPDRRKESALAWFYRNRDKVRETQRKRKKWRQKNDLDYRLRKNLRSRLHKALTRASAAKSGKTMDLTGCTVEELKAHLARQFAPGMTWDNYGHGPGRWNVDHRLPCAAFDLTEPEQQRACFRYSNLQPMWHPENVRKGAKIQQGERR